MQENMGVNMHINMQVNITQWGRRHIFAYLEKFQAEIAKWYGHTDMGSFLSCFATKNEQAGLSRATLEISSGITSGISFGFELICHLLL